MNRADYDRFTEHLRLWAEQHPEVLGLVALGSMAGTSRQPDRWSDHDFWVIASDEAALAMREDRTWLPDADRIVLFFAETEHGRNAVYDDGHLVEQAVFGNSELEIASANDYRVLVDKADIGERMAAIVARTSERRAAVDAGASFGKFAAQLVIGLTRYGRGEVLSADVMVKGWALGNLLELLGRYVEPETAVLLDNLDPRRRFEAAFPALGGRLAAATEAPVPEAAAVMLDIAEAHLDAVAANTRELRMALRRLLARAR